VLSISNGFKSNIENKIIEFDGYARIFKNDLSISQKEFLIDDTNFSLSKFTEIQSLVRANNISEGITYQTVDKINFLDNFLIHKSTDSLKGIYIGVHLSEKLFSDINSIDEKIFIIHNSNIYQKKISGIFRTNIPLYDKHTIIELDANDFKYEGFIVNRNDYLSINELDGIQMYTYKDRYYDFIKWLDSYNLPIYLLLLFIIIISIVNNTFCFKLDFLNRYNDINIFNTIGLSQSSIINLFWLKYLVLNLFGIIFGSSLSLFVLLIEKKFSFIKLPEEVYFTSILPISSEFSYFLIVPTILIVDILYKRIKIRKYFYEN